MLLHALSECVQGGGLQHSLRDAQGIQRSPRYGTLLLCAALGEVCTALGQVSTLILQEKSSNTNNDTNTNSNTVQYCCEVFRFLTVVKCFGLFECFGSLASPV